MGSPFTTPSAPTRRRSPPKVDALAASIAAVIAQAGDRRMMVTGSQMMIHEAWGLARGGAEHMRDSANILDKLTDNIAGIYAERAGGTKAHFLALMKAETWMTPVEALKEGLIDDITKPELSQAETQKSNADSEAPLCLRTVSVVPSLGG